MTTVWIIVIIFILIAVGAGLAQLAASWGDKKISDDVASDPGRLHADPSRDVEDGPGDEPGEHDERGNH
jgi:hypothetical protein